MLAVLNLDGVSQGLVRRLEEEGRLPALASLRARGTHHGLASDGESFAAATYATTYTGLPLPEHGLYYPFLWRAEEQRVRYVHRLPWPPAIWDRLADAGRRQLVIDPYEAHLPARADGLWVTGLQFTNRVVLPAYVAPGGSRSLLRAAGLGRATSVDEVFGRQTAGILLAMRKALLAAPARAATLATEALRRERFDSVWISFSSGHIGGHQFWSLAQLDDRERELMQRAGAESTLSDIYVAIDEAVGRVLEALPDDADVLVFSGLGMNANTSRSDLLPGMLDAVLGRTSAAPRRTSPTASLWRIRATVPTGARAAVARALPRELVLTLGERLETPARDWSQVRAFALPSDTTGYVRLNLRGRERDGIVSPAAAEALRDEIAQGLATFDDPDGAPAVAAVVPVADRYPNGGAVHALPDLLVRWANRPSAALDGVSSPTFGDVRRQGVGSGRSGNHVDDAWAIAVAAQASPRPADGMARLEDVPATVLALAGVATDALAGTPLLVRG